MRECGSAFELAENLFFVVEEVADESIGMFFVHCYGCVSAGTEDAGGYVGSESGDEGFVCRGEFNETCEMSCQSVEGGDVGET